MKILQVISYMAPRYGGPPKACRELSEALAARGHQVTVISTNQDGDSALPYPTGTEITENGVKYCYYPIHFPRYWLTSLPLARGLWKYIPQYDIVHIHSLYFFQNLVAPLIARHYKKPYILTPHGSLMSHIYSHHRFRKTIIEYAFERKNLAIASAVHFTSDRERQESIHHFSLQQSFTTPWGIMLSDYMSLDKKLFFSDTCPANDSSRMILFLGRLHDFKSPDIVIRSFRIVAEMMQDVKLVMVGTGEPEYIKSLKDIADTLGISDRITWCGMLTGDRKMDILRRADICIMPSRVESYGLVVLESMASGIPLVVSDQVSLADEVLRSGAGLVTLVDPAACAEAIVSILGSGELSKQMGINGRDYVTRHYDWSKRVLEFEEMYESRLK